MVAQGQSSTCEACSPGRHIPEHCWHSGLQPDVRGAVATRVPYLNTAAPFQCQAAYWHAKCHNTHVLHFTEPVYYSLLTGQNGQPAAEQSDEMNEPSERRSEP